MTMLALVLILAAAPTSPPAATGAKEAPAAKQAPGAKQAPAAKQAPTAPASPPARPQSQPRPAEAKKDAAKPPGALAAPAAPVPKKPFRWDVPGLVMWVDSAGVQVSDGVPMILQMALSKQPIDTLIQHFADEFQKAGFFIPPGRDQVQALREPQLTAFDPTEQVAYTVIFQENKDKSVTLILAKSDLSNYKPGGSPAPAWAPMPAGATDLMSMEMEGGSNVVFSVSAATSSQEQVMAFYREELKKAGFVETEKDPGEFRKPGETIRVSTRIQDGQIMVALTRRLGSDGEGPL